MIRFVSKAATVACLLVVTASYSLCLGAVTFDWAYVGNAGNAADSRTGLGAVSYNYAISKTEVTNSQYAEFLNAVDAAGANPLKLYVPAGMASEYGGIYLTGSTDGSRYVVQPSNASKPVIAVSAISAMRFANWLHNGQGAGDTETGAYTLLGGIPLPTNYTTVVRNPDAKFTLPSADEWMKAAHHDASAGLAGVYFEYATAHNSIPYSDNPSNLNAPDPTNVANYLNNDLVANGYNEGYAVTGSPILLGDANPLTEVGAYSLTTSPYGLYDTVGNVREWTESFGNPNQRRRAGDSWGSNPSNLDRSPPLAVFATVADYVGGLRIVATIPEPTSLALAAMLAGCGMMGRRRSQLT
jgi:sulfatase modifying factor 1